MQIKCQLTFEYWRVCFACLPEEGSRGADGGRTAVGDWLERDADLSLDFGAEKEPTRAIAVTCMRQQRGEY